jgi:hypothetical protein
MAKKSIVSIEDIFNAAPGGTTKFPLTHAGRTYKCSVQGCPTGFAASDTAEYIDGKEVSASVKGDVATLRKTLDGSKLVPLVRALGQKASASDAEPTVPASVTERNGVHVS